MGHMLTNASLIYDLAFGMSLVFASYSLIFIANSTENKVIMIWHCLLAINPYFNRSAIKRWIVTIPGKRKI